MLRFSMLWLALACWNAAPVIADTVPHRLPRALLITGLGTTDPGHPKHILRHEFYNDEIARALEGIVDVTVTEDLQSLNPATLRNHDLILNNSFLLEPSPDQLTAFFEFIEQGGSYIALHAGLESFVNSPRYVRMMGGRLAGHSPLRPFIVETFEEGFGTERSTPWSHPITRGMPVFETQDELYVVQTNTQELEVIARGESHPIVWWRPWYNGSVLAFTLGHSRASVQNAGYQALLRNCVRWLLGYPIIEPLHRVVLSNDAGEVEDVLDLRWRDREDTHRFPRDRPRKSPFDVLIFSYKAGGSFFSGLPHDLRPQDAGVLERHALLPRGGPMRAPRVAVGKG